MDQQKPSRLFDETLYNKTQPFLQETITNDKTMLSLFKWRSIFFLLTIIIPSIISCFFLKTPLSLQPRSASSPSTIVPNNGIMKIPLINDGAFMEIAIGTPQSRYHVLIDSHICGCFLFHAPTSTTLVWHTPMVYGTASDTIIIGDRTVHIPMTFIDHIEQPLETIVGQQLADTLTWLSHHTTLDPYTIDGVIGLCPSLLLSLGIIPHYSVRCHMIHIGIPSLHQPTITLVNGTSPIIPQPLHCHQCARETLPLTVWNERSSTLVTTVLGTHPYINATLSYWNSIAITHDAVSVLMIEAYDFIGRFVFESLYNRLPLLPFYSSFTKHYQQQHACILPLTTNPINSTTVIHPLLHQSSIVTTTTIHSTHGTDALSITTAWYQCHDCPYDSTHLLIITLMMVMFIFMWNVCIQSMYTPMIICSIALFCSFFGYCLFFYGFQIFISYPLSLYEYTLFHKVLFGCLFIIYGLIPFICLCFIFPFSFLFTTIFDDKKNTSVHDAIMFGKHQRVSALWYMLLPKVSEMITNKKSTYTPQPYGMVPLLLRHCIEYTLCFGYFAVLISYPYAIPYDCLLLCATLYIDSMSMTTTLFICRVAHERITIFLSLSSTMILHCLMFIVMHHRYTILFPGQLLLVQLAILLCSTTCTLFCALSIAECQITDFFKKYGQYISITP